MIPAKKILIIHHGALGDLVLTFPVMMLLKKSGAAIDILCTKRLGKLACDLGMAENAYALESAAFASLYTYQVDAKVKAILAVYDTFLVFSNSDTLAETLKQAFATDVIRIPPRPPTDQRIHVTEHLLNRLRNTPFFQRLQVSDATGFSEIILPDHRAIGFDVRKIIIHPGSGSRKKNWPLENFMQADKLLCEKGYAPEFILGPAERSMAKPLSAQKETRKRIRLPSDLSELLALLKSAGGYMGNDSGVTHLAAFMGLPGVAVFGPSDPGRWKPLGKHVCALRPALDCRPCFEIPNADCDDHKCLNDTTPQEAVKALLSLLE